VPEHTSCCLIITLNRSPNRWCLSGHLENGLHDISHHIQAAYKFENRPHSS